MLSSHSTRWVTGAALGCVAGLAGSWMFLVSPVLEDTAATRTQAAGVRAQNAVLTGQLTGLQTEFEQIDDLRAQLAALRGQMPTDDRLAALGREIDAAARSTGVTLVGVDVGQAVAPAAGAVTATAPPAQTPAPAADEATAPSTTSPASAGTAAASAGTAPAAAGTAPAGDAAAAAAAAPAASPAAPAVEGLVAIPVATTVAGPLASVRAFLDQLQTGLERQLLITSLSVDALEPSSGDVGRPAADGDVEVLIGAYAYVLPSDTAPVTSADVAGPLPSGAGRSPFQIVERQPDGAVPPPDPAAQAADAVADAIEARLAAATAAAQAQAEAQAAATAQAMAEAAAAAAVPPATEVDATQAPPLPGTDG